MFFRGEGVQANNMQAYIVLKMAAVNSSDVTMDNCRPIIEHIRSAEELQVASQVLGQIFRSYLDWNWHIDSTPSTPVRFPPAQTACSAARRYRALTLTKVTDFSGIGMETARCRQSPLARLDLRVPRTLHLSSMRTIGASARSCAPRPRTAP